MHVVCSSDVALYLHSNTVALQLAQTQNVTYLSRNVIIIAPIFLQVKAS